jgi:uncharacterized protein (DUF1330 family)
MPAYIIASEVINDRDEFDKYRALVHGVLDKYKGEIIISNENVEIFEGEWPYTKTVVIRFPSIQQAKRWYESPEYQEIIQYRIRATTTNLILVDGKA